MTQKAHVMHGRDHCPDGADPIPCLGASVPPVSGGTYEALILAEPSLIGYWPLNEASGDAIDYSSGGNDFANPGDFYGPPTQGASGPFPGRPEETSYDFGGRLQQDVGVGGIGIDSGAISFECWIYPTDEPPFYGMPFGYIGDGVGSAVTFLGQIRDTHYVLVSLDASAPAAQLSSSPTTINFDEWTHVVVVGSGSETIKMYWNGELVAEGSTFAVSDNSTVMIGGSVLGVGSYPGFGGRIAQVAVYDAVLTESQIDAHYLAGASVSDAGKVLVVNDDGTTSWKFVTGDNVEDGSLVDADISASADIDPTKLEHPGGTTSFLRADGTWAAPTSFDPATATTWWFPLIDSDGTCVLDESGDLIPTLVPLP